MYNEIPNLRVIQEAHKRIKPYIHRTPVLSSSSINQLIEAQLYFKCENFQKVGAFKMRGATNAIMAYSIEDRKNGFVTHSSGNHAQAVALASKLAGSKAYIVMPNNAPEVKKKAVEGYGAEVTYCEPNESAREATCDEVIKRTNAIFIPPFNDSRIIAGQATAAKELLEEHPDLDFIVTPVGGGGLSAGTALIAKYMSPETDVLLAEPLNVDDTYRSFYSGIRSQVGDKKSIADGLLVSVGELNFEIIKNNAKGVITVSEDEILNAMRLIWERMKIIIEPSSAVAIAAVIKHKNTMKGKKIGVIISGGNVDLGSLSF
jgi:threonine dehydratase